MATNEEGFLDYEGLRRFYHRLKTIIDTGGNLTYPSDAVYILNPKNCTADSIKAVGGVIDGSGYGYHGQAYGDVSVSAGGKGFDFGGTNGYIRVSDNIAGILSTNIECLTLTARFKTTASNCFIGSVKRGASAAIQLNVSSGKGRCGGRTKNADAFKGVSTTANVDDGKWHTLTAILDYLHGTMKLYLDEALSATSSLVSAGEFEAVDCCYISNDSSFFQGSISDFRIYNRALGENEIKSLYIIPQEALPTRVTGDLIAKDEPVITDLAQLKDDVVESIVHKSDLKYPTGAILNLNPKNCTTESIKTANGVIDGSGYGHHGIAVGGVSVLDGGEGFSFDGSSGVISFNNSSLTSRFNNLSEMSLIAKLKINSFGSDTDYLISLKTQVKEDVSSWLTLYIDPDTHKMTFAGRWKESDYQQNWSGCYDFLAPQLNTEYTISIVCDFENGIFKAFVDGVLLKTENVLRSGNFRALYNGENIFIGALQRTQYCSDCILTDFRIYPRALSDVEVKTLYMFPQKAGISRVATDIIGSEAVKIGNLDSNIDVRELVTIDVDEDLNNMKDPRKMYRTASTVICRSILNKPSGMPEGELFVEYKAMSNIYGTQFLNARSNQINRNYQRSYSRGVWGAWKDLQAWCYNNDTTYINGGIIYANTIKANSLSVEAIKKPSDCVLEFSPKGYLGNSFAVGDIVSDLSGGGRAMKLSNATGMAISRWNIPDYCFFFPSGGTSSLVTEKRLTLNLPYTMRVKFQVFKNYGSNSGNGIFGNAWGGENNTTQQGCNIGIQKSTGYLDITKNNSDNYINLGFQENQVVDVVVIVTSTGAKFYVDGVHKGIVGYANYGAGNYLFSLNRQLVTNSSYCANCPILIAQVYNRALSDDEIMTLYKLGTDTESSQITSDRLSPDAVTSRNYNSTTVASYFSTAGFSYNLADGSLKGKFLSFNETNGYYAGTTVSRCDREIKSKISEISTLNKLKQLDIYSWKYDRDKIAIKEGNKPEGIGTTESPMNIAPMAQDFNKLFGVCYNGEDYIDHLDMIGVALASIKELAQQLDDAVVEIRRLKRILKSRNIITDEIILADKDSEAIRRLEIEQKRQLKREQKIREKVLENEEINNSENTSKNDSESSEEADKSV